MVATPRSIDAGIGIGEIFLDKYRVDSILGHGGMGVVAQCTHLALNELVAIKMLRRDVLDDPEAVKRFMREAQAAARLKSEFVARVTDVGESETKVPYMVMEYLEGHDLGNLLDDRGSLGVPWAVELTLQACEALAEAHSIGIVHRDVKPTNLFVTWRPDGSALIKVLDFGISKLMVAGMDLTQTQSLLGTPAYMSPEQMRSARQVDFRTDIWSLGTVLYEMLEGHRPFEAESFSEMCVKVAVDLPQPMFLAPPALQQVVMRCLEKAPESRYASMAELAAELVPFSNDPHQAQVLVERMSRTLRRSLEFPRMSMPMAARDARSAERKAEVAPAADTLPADALAIAHTTPHPAASPALDPGASVTPSPAASAVLHPAASLTPSPAASAVLHPAASATPSPVASATPSSAANATPNPAASATNATPRPAANPTPDPRTPRPATSAPASPAAGATPDNASDKATSGAASPAPAPVPASATHVIPSRRRRIRAAALAVAAVAGAAVLGGVISLVRAPASARPGDSSSPAVSAPLAVPPPSAPLASAGTAPNAPSSEARGAVHPGQTDHPGELATPGPATAISERAPLAGGRPDPTPNAVAASPDRAPGDPSGAPGSPPLVSAGQASPQPGGPPATQTASRGPEGPDARPVAAPTPTKVVKPGNASASQDTHKTAPRTGQGAPKEPCDVFAHSRAQPPCAGAPPEH
ncbi:MAG TPA: protein kinase [Kofleriaceae bacterium]|nr:protein kinase [Kofleriaceae bacterium]